MLVATAGPGADSTYGTPSAVVLPDRGAMNAISVSSHEAYSAGPRPPGCSRSPSSRPMSAGLIRRELVPARDGRSRAAVRADGRGVSGSIPGLRRSAATGSPWRGSRAAIACHASAMPAATATR